MGKEFEPNIIGFLCNWCSYAGADLAGTSRIKYPPNIKSIRVMCSGRVDTVFVLEALKKGADGGGYVDFAAECSIVGGVWDHNPFAGWGEAGSGE